MLFSYLKAVYRQIFGNFLYSAINILGLSIGLACCLLILLYVRHEQSYETQFANADRIYRVSREIFPTDGARLRIPASNNAPVSPALLADYPQYIEQTGRIFWGGIQLKTDELSAVERDVRMADQSILQIFDFDWIAGDEKTALATPGSIVLTETLALKYFGTREALGRVLDFGGTEVKVTGVIENLPANTHLSITGLISSSSTASANFERWNGSTDFHTYVMLRSGASIEPIVSDVDAFLTRHISAEDAAGSTMRFMKIRDIHLRSDRDEEWKSPGNAARVYSFMCIAFSILVIACINFMSIATARSATRAREVAMRKTLGSSQAQLVMQFLGEAGMFAVLSILLAVAMAEMLLPTFRTFAGAELNFAWFENGYFIVITTALTVFVACLAGSYPAFYLATFKPAAVLKGNVTKGKQGLQFRNSLVVLQFSIAIVLLVSTAVMYLQRRMADTIDMGFDKDNIVVVNSTGSRGFLQDWSVFKQELLKSPAIEQVTTSHFLPFGFNDNQAIVAREGSAGSTRIQVMLVDYDFFATYDIALLSGRDFAVDRPTDVGDLAATQTQASLKLILNESAARALSIDAQADIESKLLLPEVQMEGTLTGLVEDTLFESILSPARPLAFILAPPQERNLLQFRTGAIKIRAGANEAVLAHLERTWQQLYPGQTLAWRYLDDDLAARFQAEEKQAQLLGYFSLLAVLIACFGLFGLASFNAERRTKEIGVRKVMGGSVWSIVVLLTNDFSKLVLLSNLIAWPVAYIAMQRWLENFAYRVDLTPVIFIGSGLIALCIAWVTVGGTAARAANAKPILALRYE